MAAITIKFLIALCISMPSLLLTVNADNENILDIETPQVFNYNSPLKQPDSLRSRPYFDFLSTLYRHDNTKSELFRPYLRQRRDVASAEVAAAAPAPVVVSPIPAIAAAQPQVRRKRAILFRPLFVYKQQQVRKQEAAERRRRRYRV